MRLTNTTTLKRVFAFLFFLAGTLSGFSQEAVPFTPRLDGGNVEIRGDIIFVGNNILNRASQSNPSQANNPYNGTQNNNSLWMEYIDIDGDPSTFSSSSAELTVPDASCSLVRYAGLYWASTYPNERSTNGSAPFDGTPRFEDWNEIKFRMPGGSYIDLVADNAADPAGEEDDIIFDGYDPVNINNSFKDSPVICYKNVTNLVQSLADPNGEYTVANIRATKGRRRGSSSAGWVLVIIYENPNETGKFISTFDGYAGVQGSVPAVNVDVNGFRTLPTGFPVRARIGVAALEGDRRISGDRFRIRANSVGSFTNLTTGLNPSNNFFNSTITTDGAEVPTRTPFGTNTLGLDLDVFELNNPFNSVLPNDETGATLQFTSSGDGYGSFLASFVVEIIEPDINLQKTVEDIAGNDITGAGVNLGQIIDYVLAFQNTGNDDATNYTIRDVLPINVTLDESSISLPPGVTYTYDAGTREVTFTIPDNLVEQGDPIYEIRMRVQVAENCFDFINACTDVIENVAFSTYRGALNSATITDDPSVSDFDNCGFATPGATNFLLDDLENCDFYRTVELCGNDVILDAGDNFDSYVWYRDNNGDGLIDAGDTVITDGDPDNDPSTLLVNDTGQYIVDKIVADPCKGFEEIIEVVLPGATQTNPIADLINDNSNTVEGEVVTCPNDGEPLPKIFLCGLNDTELIEINIPDATSIVWEQLDEASCADVGDDCANKNSACGWNPVDTGFDFLASDPGEYRVVINYQNGCFTRFYFNIFKNPLNPQANVQDIICSTPGNITITNVPADYEFQLQDAVSGAVLVPYSAANGPSFDISTNGAYTVAMRQLGVVDGCEFFVENIGVLSRDFQVDVVPQDADCNGLGSIAVSVLDVEPQYYYEISLGGSVVDTFGPSADNNYTFENLNAGTYDVRVTTDDGCLHTEQVDILDVSDLDLEARVSQHITCREGNILMSSTGGQTPHTYAIWEYVDEGGTTQVSYPDPSAIPASEFQTSQIFDILDPGTYSFVMVDRNNCFDISNPVVIEFRPAAEFDPTTVTDALCFGEASGGIQFNITNSNGYQLTYYLFDATGFDENNYDYTNALATNTSGSFPGLPAGDYVIVINQRRGGVSCDYFEYQTVSGPAFALSGDAALIQPYTCLQDASIQAQNIAGGTAPYEYSLDGIAFGGSDTFAGLTAGTYTITIRDAAGCTVQTAPITIAPLDPPDNLDFTASAPTCPALTSDVTATVSNGTAPFTIEIIAPAAIAADASSGNTATFNGLTPDTYTFRVTDANGCTYQENLTINPVTPIVVSGQAIAPVSCLGGNDGEALFSISGFATAYDYNITGPASFSGTAETNASIPLTGLAAGTYDITVTDTDTNCTDTASVTIDAPSAALTLAISAAQPSCTADGSITLTAAGGWGSYTYTLTLPDTSTQTNTTGQFTGLTLDGLYSAVVTDANGCTDTADVTLNAAVPPVLDLTANDICYDDAAGLTLTAAVTSGGDGNFLYRLNGGAYGASNTFGGLGPGTYTVDVIDGNNCTDSATITVDPELSLSAAADPIAACATDTDILISAAGGDGNFVYAVVADGATPVAGDFVPSNTLSVSGAGDYDVYVRDNNGGSDYCEASLDLIITQDPALAISIGNSPILCSGDASSTLIVTPSGGEAPYQYQLNGGSFQPSNEFYNLGAGSYTLRVRDNSGCEVSQIYSISEPFTLSASAALTELVECDPALGAEVRITNVIGGTAPYEYSFDGGLNYGAASVTNLLPGGYTLYVRDANGCTFPMDVTVPPAPDAPEFTSSVDYDCSGDGTITLTPNTTDFDYTFSLNGSPNTPADSNVFSGVAPGLHTVAVSYISNVPPPPSNLLLETFGTGPNTSIPEVDPAYCYEPQDGSANSCGWGVNNRIQDGEYSVTQVITNPYGSWLSPNDHSGDPGGRFLAMNVGGVVGPNGIIYAKPNIEVVPNQDITISLWAFNLLRNGTGGADPDINIQLVDGGGTVIASTTTGNVPKNNGPNDWQNYTVNLNPGANSTLDIVIRTNSAVTGGNDIAIDDIQAYQDPVVCPSTLSFDVLVEDGYAFEANLISQTNLSCAGDNSGEIVFEIENFDTINGFEYQINGGGFSAPQTSSQITLSGLAAAAYTIEVRDVLDPSCSITLNATLTEPAALVAAASITETISCTNAGATITASATGGTPGYLYQLEDNLGAVITAYQSSPVFTAVPAGDYILRVQDTNGCEDPIDTAITIAPPESLAFTATPTACYSGNNDAEILVSVTDGNGGYLFNIDGGPWLTPSPATATSYTFGGLVPGTYDINVRDAYGCVGTPVSVTINPELLASAVLTADLTCLAPATIDVNASGGSGSYSYEWSDDAGVSWNPSGFTGNTFTTNTDGTYVFRVTDTTSPTACTTITDPVIVTPTETPVITSVTPTDILCNGEETGILDVVIDTTIGFGPFTVEVFNTTTSTSYGAQTTGLPAGDYEVTVTDAKGCPSVPFPVTISQPDAIAYDIDLQSIICDPMSGGTIPGSITVENLVGGTGEYTYHLTGNNGTDQQYNTTAGGEDYTFTILEFGIYEVDVVDANGCSLLTTNIIASPPNDLDIDVSTATVSCAAGGTAIVTVSSLVGSGNYEFAILENYAVPYSSSYQAPDVPGGDTTTFTGLTPGITYTFVVHDLTTMCYYFETAAAPINTPSNMTVSNMLPRDITCTGAADGSVTFDLENFDPGATAVNYEVFDFQSNAPLAPVVSGSIPVNPPAGPVTLSNIGPLDQGVYYVLLTEVGGPNDGCSVATPDFTISQSTNLLQVTADSPQNDNCNPNAGVITATAQFGTAPYEFQYLLSTDPAPAATDPGWTTDTSANVESGNYIVYVKDANDCIQSDPVTVGLDPRPEIDIAVVDECAPEGAFEVLVTLTTPGVGPYQISVNGGVWQPVAFDGLNQYTVTGLSSGLAQDIAVRGLYGCADTDPFDIQPPLQFNASLTTLLDCEPAPNNNAEITIEVTSGSGSYDYEVSGPVNQARAALPSPIYVWELASLPGTYTITVYDTSTSVPNCLGTVDVEVPPAIVPQFTETHQDVTCFGDSDGYIQLFQTDTGINPLTYSISPVAGTFNAATDTFENLPAGTYEITATGTNGCTEVIPNIIIGEPSPVVVPAPTVTPFGCPSGNNPDPASILLDTSGITGGSGTYTVYEFINDQATATTADDVVVQSGNNPLYTETHTAGGSYTINVYDSNGCLGSTTAVIPPYDELTNLSAAITNPLSCVPGADGEITLTATSTSGNTALFEYSIDNGASWQASNVFGGLVAGTYTFQVRHLDTGCVRSVVETLTDPNTFDISVDVLSDVVCHGTQTGEVTFELVDATYSGGFDWVIYDTNGTQSNPADDVLVDSGNSPTTGPTTPILLFAGEYRVDMSQTSTPQCTQSEIFTISGPSAPLTASVDLGSITCAGMDGSIEIYDVQGGWGNYEYYVGTSAPAGPGDYVASPLFAGLGAGTYQAWVIDARGCSELIQDNIVLADPVPITASLQINQENCTSFDGEIEVVGVTGGQGTNYTYQLVLNGSDYGVPQTSPVFSGLGAGSFEVRITDQWGCTALIGPEVLYEEMVLSSTLVKPLDCTASPDGEISIAVLGGSGNFEYAVTYPDGITTAINPTGVFNGLSQVGTYVFVVSDLDTTPNCTETISVELAAPTPVTLDPATVTDVSCFGGTDGSILVNLQPAAPGVNDNPPYTYELFLGGSSIAGPGTDPLFTGLAQGTYVVEVVSDRSCVVSQNITVGEPTALSLNATATPFACAADNTINTSTITTTAAGGTAPYLYSMDGINYQASPSFEVADTGSPQPLTITVRDANGCEVPYNLTLEPLNTFSASVSQTAAISCLNPEEVLISVADDGNPANSYTFELLPVGNPDGVQVLPNPSNTEAVFELTTPGSYVFRVTDTATGCYVTTLPHEVAPYDLIEAVVTPLSSVTCFGDTDGSLSLEINGYTGAYDYEVFEASGASTGISASANTATNPITINGLSGGNYFVRVTQTDAPFCGEDSNIITIMSPDMPLTIAVSEEANVTCDNNQGEILVSPEGGYAPYDIVLTNTTTAQSYTANGVNAQLFSGLSAGAFTVRVTDANGCEVNDLITLSEPAPITAGIDAAPAVLACYGDTNGVVNALNVTGGSGDYTYSLNYYDASGTTITFSGGFQGSDTFTGLGAGIYSITVADGWNCDIETAQVSISEPTQVLTTLVQTVAMTCTGDAGLLLTANGGTAPYEYSVDGVVYSPMAGGDTQTFSVSDGTFQYYVRDAQGCEASISNQISIEPIAPLTVDIDESAAVINCTGEMTASLVATATGGLGNYQYELYGDAALTNLIDGPQTDRTFSELGVGSYWIRVTSADCETVSGEIIVTEPAPLQVDREEFTNVSCSGEADGTITIEVSGGTGDILYAISPNLNQFDDVNTFTELEAGVYDVIAQDENGCFITFQFTITEPAPLQVDYTVTPEVCAGTADGAIDIVISGGTAPYQTAFNSNLDADFGPAQTTFTDLAAGTYVIFVRDAQGCETNVIVEVDPGVNLNATVTPVYECAGTVPDNYLEVLLEDPSVSEEVMYALDSTDPAAMQLEPDFSSLSPGPHYLAISHTNGCVLTIDFEIAAFEPLSLALEQQNINEITAIAAGGSPEYTYIFNGDDNGNDNTWYITETGTYLVQVMDENGCVAEAEIFMEFIDIEIPNYFTPDGDGQNDFWMPDNTEGFPEILIKIYDRYGRVLTEITYGSQGWDGMYDGKELPSGDYWYTLKLNGERDKREFVGHFTLYR